ncbi:MAG: hypothetical protein ACOYXW_16725 [Actinomycetota bacterium]
MTWDLGPLGLGLLVAMALVFGALAQLIVRMRWTWLVAAGGYFLVGLFVSEVMFGWATEEELQPNVDGLSFDEVLLTGLVPGLLTVLLVRYLTRRSRDRRAHPRPSSSLP